MQKCVFWEASRSEKVRKLTRLSKGGADKFAAHKRNKYVLPLNAVSVNAVSILLIRLLERDARK